MGGGAAHAYLEKGRDVDEIADLLQRLFEEKEI
jgi:hypothetical protein